MRVSESMRQIREQLDLARGQTKLLEHQQVAMSGQRVSKPSVDPTAAAQIVSLRAQSSAASQHVRNVQGAASQVATTDTALQTASELMAQAHDLALGMANGTVSAAERRQAALSVSLVRDQLIALGNTRHGEVYVFGGHRTDTPPFAPSGAFLGDDGQRRVLADDGLTLEVGVSGGAAFGATGGQNVFTALDSLAAALNANDATAIASAGAGVASAENQLADMRGAVGRQAVALDAQILALGDRQTVLAEAQSGLVDADAMASLSAVVQARQSLNATVAVSARLLSSLGLAERL